MVTLDMPLKGVSGPPLRSAGLVQPPQDARSQPKANTTKAERRAQQEAQRAAKAANKDQPQQQKPKGPAPPRKPGNDKQNLPSKESSSAKGPTTASASAPDKPSQAQSRSLRIFSHFADPKVHPSVTNKTKNLIHPVIARLALQFSSFRICGANARCIATLSAFKIVRTTLTRAPLTHSTELVDPRLRNTE